MVYKILHMADIHLDTCFAGIGLPPHVGAWRRIDLLSTLSRILSLARDQGVDAVTIAGDLYEQDYTLPNTAEFLVQQFSKLSPIKVFIAPGKADPYINDSLYARTRWPSNVTIFSQSKLSAIELAPNIHLWGAAYPPARDHRDLENFHVNRPGTNLLLLHAADIEQPEQEIEGLCLINEADVKTSGFQFALLGSEHNGRAWPGNSPTCVYPGSPQPLCCKDGNGNHHVVLLTIEDGICKPMFIPIGQWRYISLEVTLDECPSNEELATHIQGKLETLQGINYESLICRFILVGKPDFELDIEKLLEQINAKAYVHFDSHMSIPYELSQLAQERTVRGLLIQRFQTRIGKSQNENERKLILNALYLALRALDGKQVKANEIA